MLSSQLPVPSLYCIRLNSVLQARQVWVPSEARYRGRAADSQAGSQVLSCIVPCSYTAPLQATLLSPARPVQRWPRGSDFLGAATAFTLSLHTL